MPEWLRAAGPGGPDSGRHISPRRAAAASLTAPRFTNNMHTALVLLAGLLSLSAADHSFFYKTSVRRGFFRDQTKSKFHYYIPAGQCSAALSYASVCLLADPSAGLKVSVRDNSPYPQVRVNESSRVITVRRGAGAGGCAGPARVSLKLDCHGSHHVPAGFATPLLTPDRLQAGFNSTPDDSRQTIRPDDDNQENRPSE